MDFFEVMSLIGSAVLVALVLVLTWFGARWYARRMGGSAGKYVKVVDKTPLGQRDAVYIVKAGQRYFLLGAADKSICLLSELTDFEEQPPPEGGGVPFRSILQGVMKKDGSQKDESRQEKARGGDQDFDDYRQP